jgi:hypothetical protein
MILQEQITSGIINWSQWSFANCEGKITQLLQRGKKINNPFTVHNVQRMASIG